MRVGVFSDSHGDHEALDELLDRMGALDAVCFLGDVARDAEHLQERLAAMPNQPPLYAVRGAGTSRRLASSRSLFASSSPCRPQ